MKIKSDFVTNSSSTSFIIVCEADAQNIIDFADMFNRALAQYIKDNGWNENIQMPPMLTNEKVKQTEPGIFVITECIPIDNSTGGMLQFVQDVFIDNGSEASKKFNSSGIRIINAENKNLNE